MSRSVFLSGLRSARLEELGPPSVAPADLQTHPLEDGTGKQYLGYLTQICGLGALEDEAFCQRLARWIPVRLYGAVSVYKAQAQADILVCLAGDLLDACPEALDDKIIAELLEALRGYKPATELAQRQLESALVAVLGRVHLAVAAEFSEVFEQAVLGQGASFEFAFEYLRRANNPDATARFLLGFDTRRLAERLHGSWWRLAAMVCWKAGGEDEAALRDKTRWLQPSPRGEQWLAACGIDLEAE